MSRCPWATWDPIGIWSNGGFNGAPLRIIHHKTQGSSYPRSTYLKGGGVPHFTVSATQTWQHFDTERAARALANYAGGVSPNQDGSIQIEAVGYSGEEDLAVAREVARLCRWLEAEHGIPNVWPLGRPPQFGAVYPAPVDVWLEQGGHYAHSQAPENRDAHWDPAYTDGEWALICPPAEGLEPQTLNPQPQQQRKDPTMQFVITETGAIYVVWPTATGLVKRHVSGAEWKPLQGLEPQLVRTSSADIAGIPDAAQGAFGDAVAPAPGAVVNVVVSGTVVP